MHNVCSASLNIRIYISNLSKAPIRLVQGVQQCIPCMYLRVLPTDYSGMRTALGSQNS